MKDKVVNKEGWIWPAFDENAWKHQNDFIHLVDKLLPHLRNRDCMVQAGGNCGYMLSTFVPLFKTIYTFEPDPVNFYCLTNNVTSENVIKFQACVGSRREQVNTVQLIREDRPNDIGGVHIQGSGNIPTVIIDDLNLQSCDLIQFDVEGYELHALIGSKQTIEKHKPVLCIEFCEKWLNRYNNNSSEILQFLQDLGYKEVDSYGVDKIFVHLI